MYNTCMNDLNKLQNKKYIIYDFDGTIAKVNIDWSNWHNGVERIFLKYEPTFIRNGLVNQFQNPMVLKYGKPLKDEICKFNEIYEMTLYKDLKLNTQLIDYIKNNPKKINYILTSQNKSSLIKMLDELRITNYFYMFITRDDILFLKPDPEGIKKILLSNDVNDFIMLGDSIIDEQTAKSVNMDFEYIKIL